MKTPTVPRKIVFKNKPCDEMMIAAYVEPLVFGRYIKDHEVKVSIDEAYDDLKASHMNTLLQTETQLNRENNQYTLDMFEHLSKRHMNFLFRDHEIVGDKNIVTTKSDKELFEYLEKAYKPLDEKYSAFAGIHYIDEPGYKDWERAKEIKSVFKQVFPDKLFFLNLLQVYAPHWAFPNGPIYMPDADWWLPDDPDYIKYYESYISKADPEIFSYDFYPMIYEFPTIRKDYFKQLHLSYKYATKSNTPLFAFIQTGTWDTATRIPNDNELRWQVNCALAYNTKAIGYYTYWVPNPFNKRMCIHEYGFKTPTYYKVQQINKELLFQDEYILNSAFRGYIMSGKTPADETFESPEKLDCFGNIEHAPDGNFFIGCFDYHKNQKIYNMYIIVNNTIDKEQHSFIRLKEKTDYRLIHRENVAQCSDDIIRLDLTPGDAYIVIENL